VPLAVARTLATAGRHFEDSERISSARFYGLKFDVEAREFGDGVAGV
jgi:hypothetical protein